MLDRSNLIQEESAQYIYRKIGMCLARTSENHPRRRNWIPHRTYDHGEFGKRIERHFYTRKETVILEKGPLGNAPHRVSSKTIEHTNSTLSFGGIPHMKKNLNAIHIQRMTTVSIVIILLTAKLVLLFVFHQMISIVAKQ